MAYPFVPAFVQLGRRKGPVLGFVVHMAEGGGTVGYLSRPNPNGVSVHYVIEYDGTIVQMVRETDASGSINPRDIRTTDDADGFFGVTANKAVLGTWWSDPNSAVISLEIEGFAAAGPKPVQPVALKKLVNDVRSRYANIGLLGHRDFADYKACPGKRIDWASIGGHGPHGDPDMIDFTIRGDTPPGSVRTVTGTAAITFVTSGKVVGIPVGSEFRVYATIRRVDNGVDCYLVGVPDVGPPAVILSAFLPVADAAIVPGPPPVVDCDDVVQAELERASVRASAAVLAKP